MKRLNSFLLGSFLLVGLSSNAQVIIDFENGSVPTATIGMVTPRPATEFVSVTSIVDNPDVTGVNKTSKCYQVSEEGTAVKMVDNKLVITLSSPITITDANRYLHFYARRNLNADNKGLLIMFNLASATSYPGIGESHITRFERAPSQTDVWQDIVLDLNLLKNRADQISTISINPNANTWATANLSLTNLYIDEMVLNNDRAPRGTNIIFPDTKGLINFEDINQVNEMIYGPLMDITLGVPIHVLSVDNPNKTGINNSNKAVSFGKGLHFYFQHSITVNEANRYLHVMVYSPISAAGFNIFAHNQSKVGYTSLQRKLVTVEDASTWKDIVIDLSTVLTEPNVPTTGATQLPIPYLSGFGITTTSAAATAPDFYYFDEILIDESATPRTTIAAGITENSFSNVNIYAKGSTIFVGGVVSANQEVTVFNIMGKMIANAKFGIQKQFEMPTTGVYIVKVGTVHKKVCVK